MIKQVKLEKKCWVIEMEEEQEDNIIKEKEEKEMTKGELVRKEFADKVMPGSDGLVEEFVNEWLTIVNDYENKTIIFALKIKRLLKHYPQNTAAEIFRRFANHPAIKKTITSAARVKQGFDLIEERPDLVEWINKSEEDKKVIPFENKPYLKRNGMVFWEFYFEMYKYRLDPGIRCNLEQNGKENVWSKRKLVHEIHEMIDEKREPHAYTRHQKSILIKEINIMLKDLSEQDLQTVGSRIIEEHKEKIDRYNKYEQAKDRKSVV